MRKFWSSKIKSYVHNYGSVKPRLHGHSDPDPGGKLDSNPDSDHLSHVDCDPDLLGPGARVNAA